MNANPGRRAWAFALMLWLALPLPAQGQPAGRPDAADRSAVLTVLNRDVITMRASIAGVGPAARVQRAEEQLRAIPASEMSAPLRTEPVSLADARGMQILLGDRLLFAVLEGDVDPTIGQSHEALVRQTLSNLEDVRRTW